MYWLLNKEKQEKIRRNIEALVEELSKITGNPQIDQLFPYVGRKDRRKARAIIKILTKESDLIIDPFSGSGSFVYAASEMNRKIIANEWEPYLWRISTAPWRFPQREKIDTAINNLVSEIQSFFNKLYQTICPCGTTHVLDTLFFDREPLRYTNVSKHERLGNHGENITFRQRYSCPICGRTEKHFNDIDQLHMEEILKMELSENCEERFNLSLIENSRINLSADFTTYGSLFPHRSKLALCKLWEGIQTLNCDTNVKKFLEDAFFSILPQAKYKDYRSKSQDLHVPNIKLREVNILHRFLIQIVKRYNGLKNYSFSQLNDETPVFCKDYREFLDVIEKNSVALILTDPPWTDGNAYFEKAQLYHPWLEYNLSNDDERLGKECVVSDAPSRREEHSVDRWWKDITEFFIKSYSIVKPLGYIALFFRPIPASRWLTNLNRLKLVARKSGFEPLLSINIGGSDPSMRIQQSASYVFSQDIVFIFVKIPLNMKRIFEKDFDIDQLVFQTAEELQEKNFGPFSEREWRDALGKVFINKGIEHLNNTRMEIPLHELFCRYCDEITPGFYLPKALTPFSGQLFDIPAIERLFTYVPSVINELTQNNERFSFDNFLLRLSEYVENGTRMLIDQIENINIRQMIEPYAEPIEEGRWFIKRKLPTLPHGLRNVLEMNPYQFEIFIGKLFEAQGYTSIGIVGRSGDRGVDVLGKDIDNNLTVIQCKRYLQHKVSSTPIQRLHSYAITRGAKRKILITTSDFTPQAISEANITDTELINGNQLEKLIASYLPDS